MVNHVIQDRCADSRGAGHLHNNLFTHPETPQSRQFFVRQILQTFNGSGESLVKHLEDAGNAIRFRQFKLM